MNRHLTLHGGRAETGASIERLSERIARLEDENIFLEEALIRNTRMFEALLSNAHGGITLTGPDRRIVRVVKGLTGFEASFFAGQLIDSLAVPEDRQSIVEAYERLLEDRCGRITISVRVPRRDGAVALFQATLADMLDNPNVQGIVWNYSPHSSKDLFITPRRAEA